MGFPIAIFLGTCFCNVCALQILHIFCNRFCLVNFCADIDPCTCNGKMCDAATDRLLQKISMHRWILMMRLLVALRGPYATLKPVGRQILTLSTLPMMPCTAPELHAMLMSPLIGQKTCNLGCRLCILIVAQDKPMFSTLVADCVSLLDCHARKNNGFNFGCRTCILIAAKETRMFSTEWSE